MKPSFTKSREIYENYAENANERCNSNLTSTLYSDLNWINDCDSNTVYAGLMETSSTCSVTLDDLSDLQKFRLKNAKDCFSVHRQMDLKIDKQLQKIEEPLRKQEKVPSSMPYAMRQRLLRLKLTAEEKMQQKYKNQSRNQRI